MPNIFIERQSSGNYHAIRNETRIAVGTTQNECGCKAKALYPERWRHLRHCEITTARIDGTSAKGLATCSSVVNSPFGRRAFRWHDGNPVLCGSLSNDSER